MTVTITQPVNDGIDYVRTERYKRSGHLHMLDTEAVRELAREGGFESAASWIEQNEEAYVEGILFGFEVGNGRLISPTDGDSAADANRANGD